MCWNTFTNRKLSTKWSTDVSNSSQLLRAIPEVVGLWTWKNFIIFASPTPTYTRTHALSFSLSSSNQPYTYSLSSYLCFHSGSLSHTHTHMYTQAPKHARTHPHSLSLMHSHSHNSECKNEKLTLAVTQHFWLHAARPKHPPTRRTPLTEYSHLKWILAEKVQLWSARLTPS